MDVRLQYVVAVARAGSITAAAETVGVTQSAITKSVASLEKQIGYAIFYRTPRGSYLTAEGRDFVDRAARLVEDTQELLQRRADSERDYAGTLRIGVGPASLEWRLLAPLSLLLKRYPGIKFDVSGSTFERTVQLLRAGAVDVALGFDAAYSDWADIHREAIQAVRSVIFVRLGHPLLDRDTVTAADLAQYDFVSPSDGRPYGVVVRKIYEDSKIEWHKRVHVVDYFPLVREVVAKSDAIGVTTDLFAQTAAFKAQFVALKEPNLLPPSTMCCAVRKRWEPKPIVRAFIRAVKETQAG